MIQLMLCSHFKLTHVQLFLSGVFQILSLTRLNLYSSSLISYVTSQDAKLIQGLILRSSSCCTQQLFQTIDLLIYCCTSSRGRETNAMLVLHMLWNAS